MTKPWVLNEYGAEDIEILEIGGNWIATTTRDHAPLLLAAPVLLSACEDLLACIRDPWRYPTASWSQRHMLALESIMDAVAKAKGK